MLMREELEKMRVEMRNVGATDNGGALHEIYGGKSGWVVYRKAIFQRFGLAYDDLLAEIKKIKHVRTVKEYIDAYDRHLCRVELFQEQSISFFLPGYKVK
ncbi:hypothetical protein Tco_1388545 [Tanacetum coccineum]